MSDACDATWERERRNNRRRELAKAKRDRDRADAERRREAFDELCNPGLRERNLAALDAIEALLGRSLRGDGGPIGGRVAAMHAADASAADLEPIRRRRD